MQPRIVIVGAGIAGLTCARVLHERGIEVRVLERSRGVGGRCATRRVDGEPVDHGLPFLHGRDPEFLRLLRDVDGATVIPDWPRVRLGQGAPCQPAAFGGGHTVLAFREGVSRLPKHLARGLHVSLGAEVTRLRLTGPEDAPGPLELVLASGELLESDAVVLTMPVPHALGLLRTLDPIPEPVARRVPTLELVRSVPTLTVIATYPRGIAAPSWEAQLPESSRVIHALLVDSSKRSPSAGVTLVIHARADYSRSRLDTPEGVWMPQVLEEAARLAGEWVLRPVAAQGHAWHHAMVLGTSELSAPLSINLGTAFLGLCGDAFDDRGGVEGAWHSARAMAARVVSWIESRSAATQGVPLGPQSR